MTNGRNPTPTGSLSATADGRDLLLARTLDVPVEEVWAWLTEPDRTARWIGRWTGTPGVGRTVRFAMAFEEGDRPSDVTITACEPPRHLAVELGAESGGWRLEVVVAEAGGGCTVTLVHHLDAAVDPGEVGPGWEYYLDNLLAAQAGRSPVEFGDYYPAQSGYYTDLAAKEPEV
ncbi:SRPBCC family protein [Georgenia sp. SUBG003]|uniref:SRPBCC family protein n=1 Tax=Georgenia sp. SUBG003 TaxID=1497974 RepID=UPI0004DA0821|nr:ATPase [Georgenia sp. SUBG003]